MGNHGIHLPGGVEVERQSQFGACFVLQPLEPRFGVTIGNALRRVLLSSLEGVVITAIRIEGVQHEFSTVPGVTEDVSDIILNLKGVRFGASEYAGEAIYHRVKGPGIWKAGDIAGSTTDYTVLNRDHYIATLGDTADFGVEMRVERGRGYVPAHENKRAEDPIGVIAIDAIYSPIKRVRYAVKPTRVQQRVDYERLEIEVETDGSITPEDAMAQAAVILRDHINLFDDMEIKPVAQAVKRSYRVHTARTQELLEESVEDLELSVRAKNCLRAADIRTVGDLIRKEHAEMLKFRNFGRKSLQELEKVLEDRGLRFGMEFVTVGTESVE